MEWDVEKIFDIAAVKARHAEDSVVHEAQSRFSSSFCYYLMSNADLVDQINFN